MSILRYYYFTIKYNYINIADFITYEIDHESYELVLNIIDNNINMELNDNDYVGIIEHIREWITDDKIKKLKDTTPEELTEDLVEISVSEPVPDDEEERHRSSSTRRQTYRQSGKNGSNYSRLLFLHFSSLK